MVKSRKRENCKRKRRGGGGGGAEKMHYFKGIGVVKAFRIRLGGTAPKYLMKRVCENRITVRMKGRGDRA